MSNHTIDNEVVELEFNNTKFESNVKESMSTLDKLKAKLNFDGATKGLDEIEKASSRIDFSGMSNGIDALSNRFDTFGIMGMTIIQNLTNKLVDFSLQLGKSMTIDQVASGWSKMDEMTGSVQTLVNATGKSVKDIYTYLDRLMWYSDETSYSFTDMTSALSQMVSSGGDIDKLIPMITGIANATAYAGKGAREFQSTIRNLTQSYQAGYLQYADVKSLNLMGTSSKALKETFISVAEEMGKVRKGYITLANFDTSLADKWATKDVMEETFNRFSALSEAAQKAVDAGEYKTASEAIEALSENFDQLAVRSFKSAQEAKTFTEAINATRDAVSSDWMKIFNNIFGTYDEQVKTWTQLSYDLYDLVVEPLNSFEDLIGKAFNSKWDNLISDFKDAEINVNGLDEAFIKFIKDSGSKTFVSTYEVWSDQVDNLLEKYGSLGAMLSGEEFKDVASSYLSDFFDQLDSGVQTIDTVEGKLEAAQKLFDDIWVRGIYGTGEERVKALAEAGIDFATAQGMINKLASEGKRSGYKLVAEDIAYLSKEQLINLGFTSDQATELKKLKQAAEEAGIPIEELIQSMGKRSGRELLSSTLTNLVNIINNLKNTVGDAWSKVFDSNKTSNHIYTVVEAIETLTSKIRSLTEDSGLLSDILVGIFSVIRTFNNVVSQLVRGGLSILQKIFQSLKIDVGDFAYTLGDSLKNFSDWIVDNDIIFTALDEIGEKIADLVGILKDWFSAIASSERFTSIVNGLKSGLSGLRTEINNFDISKLSFDSVSEKFKEFMKNLSESPKDTLEKFAASIGSIFSNIWKFIKDIPGKFNLGFDKMSDKMDTFKDRGEQVLEVFGNIATMLIGIGSGVAIFSIINKLVDAVGVLVTPLLTINDLLKSFTGVGNAVSGYINVLKDNIQTNNIIKLALALGILATGLWALAKLDSDALWNAVGAVGALMLIIAVTSKVFGSIPTIQAGAKDFATVVLSLAGSIVILAISVKMLKDLDSGQLGAGIGGTLALLASMVGSIYVIGKYCKKAEGSAKTIIAFAGSIYILSLAMKSIGTMADDPNKWVVAFIGLLECLGVMALMAFTINKFPGVKGSGKDILELSASLFIMAIAMKAIANIRSDEFIEGFTRIAFILAMFLGIAVVLKGSTTQLNGVGLTILAMSASLILIAKGIKAIAKINQADIEKSSGIILGIMAFLTGAVAVISLVSSKAGGLKQLAGLGVVILALSASLYLIVGTILILKSLDKTDVGYAAAIVSGLMLVVGASIALMNKTGALNQKNAYAAKALVSFAIILGVLAASLFVLSSLDQTKLVTSAASISAVLLSLTLMMKILVTMTKNFDKALKAIGIMALVLGSAVAALVILDKFTNGEGLMQKATTLILLIGSLSLVCTVLSVAGIAAKAAGPGIDTVLWLLVKLEAIIAATIGLASLVPPEIIDKAYVVLTKIGELIGGVFGSIISGFLVSSTSQLPEVAKNLSDFMANLSTFFEKVSTVPENASSLFDSVIDMIVKFGSTSSQRALNKLATNNTSMEGVKEFFEKFGDAIIAFSNKLSEGKFDGTAVQAAADAGTMMTSLYDSLPSTGAMGGLIDWFTGTKSLEEFGTQIEGYATSLVNMSKALTADGGFEMSAVEKADAAGQVLIKLADALPNNGPLSRLFNGNKDLAVFGAELVPFAEGLVGLCTTLNSKGEDGKEIFSQETVENAVKAGEILSSFSENLPTSDSIKNKIFGGTELGNFGNDIQNYATSLVRLCEAINSGQFDDAAIAKAETAGETLLTLINNLPESSGIDEALSTIGTRIHDGITVIMDGMIAIFDRSEDSKEAGYLTLQAYLEGVSDETLLEQLYQAGVRAAEAVNSGYREHLEVNSPSKVMKENGKFTIDGIIEGVKSKLKDLKTAGSFAAQTFKNSLENSLSLAEDTLGSDLHVTVTPVLDLSEIQNGASGLSHILDNTSLYANASGLGSQILKAKDNLNAIGNQLVVNTTFNIDNNGKDITEDTIDDWSSKIANSVNLKLGALYRR